MAALVDTTTVPPRDLPEAERLASFAKALDGVKQRVEAQVGAEDLSWIRRMRGLSMSFEVLGRGLIFVAFEPLVWSLGVVLLWLHKQIEATEIGHTVLHGAFDRIEGHSAFRSKGFHWKTPIDEEAWHEGHNLRHHQHTGIAGKDPDIHFGGVRLTEHTPHTRATYIQVPSIGWIAPTFALSMNAHFSGLLDLYFGNGLEQEFDFIEDRSWSTVWSTHRRAFRKYLPYYGKELVFFPLLAGAWWWKVILGNLASEVLRDVYTAATIWCGHVGDDVAAFPEGTRAKGKGSWYAMQVEASQNFEVPLPVSVLCGALDRQIEHHLFPRLPTQRLRQVAPEVRQICDDHGVRYHTGTWPQVLGRVLRRLWTLSFPTAAERGEGASPSA